jgi:hypothetical protein
MGGWEINQDKLRNKIQIQIFGSNSASNIFDIFIYIIHKIKQI